MCRNATDKLQKKILNVEIPIDIFIFTIESHEEGKLIYFNIWIINI